MKLFKEQDMIKGWFIGDFDPTCFNTKDVEVSVKRYKKNDSEPSHHHKVASEVTFVLSGKISMNGKEYSKGDIVLVEPGESILFKAIDDSVNVVVKIPSVKNDKYEP